MRDDSKMEKESPHLEHLELAERLQSALKRKIRREAEAGRKYTKAHFARRMDVSPQTVQHWVYKGLIDKFKLVRVARELGVSVDWLMGGDQDIDFVVLTSSRVKALVEIFQQLNPAEQDRIFDEIQVAERRRREEIDALLNKK
jgi:transcriptional regulator with XRE-family HTH domain